MSGGSRLIALPTHKRANSAFLMRPALEKVSSRNGTIDMVWKSGRGVVAKSRGGGRSGGSDVDTRWWWSRVVVVERWVVVGRREDGSHRMPI